MKEAAISAGAASVGRRMPAPSSTTRVALNCWSRPRGGRRSGPAGVQLHYTWAYAYSPDVVPVCSYDVRVAGEAAGAFEALNPGAANPYEIWTTTVLIRPIVP